MPRNGSRFVKPTLLASQREGQSDALREVSGAEVQEQEPRVLAPWILRRHGREEKPRNI